MARLKQIPFAQLRIEAEQYTADFAVPDGLHLEHVPFKNSYIQMLWREHYVESKGTVGRQFHYIVYLDRKAVGGISAGSAIFAHKKRDTFLQVEKVEKDRGLRNIVNNTMFRLTRPSKDMPLATDVLKLWQERVSKDWFEKFGDVVRCFETLVEPPRWGGIYRLDGWKRIGKTAGLGARRPEGHGTHGKNSTGKRKIIRVPKKILWVKPIMSFDDARAQSNSVDSYGDEKEKLLTYLKTYPGKEIKFDEITLHTGISASRIGVCLTVLLKNNPEIQKSGKVCYYNPI